LADLALAALTIGSGCFFAGMMCSHDQTGVALAVAACPEGPVVGALRLAAGMWRIEQHNA